MEEVTTLAWKKEYSPIVAMGIVFVTSILLGMAAAAILPPSYRAFGEDTESAVNPLIYIGITLLFTAIILFIAKMGKAKLIKFIILGSVGITIAYVLYPFFTLITDLWIVTDDGSCGIPIAGIPALAIAGALVYALLKYPEWYIVDAVGILVSAGAVAIFGISLGIFPVMLLLSILALYDAIAVYKTKHMVALADNVMEQRLPVLLVVPKTTKYSFMKQKSLKKQLEDEEERDAMFMGLGDIVVPGILVVSAYTFLPKYEIYGLVNSAFLVALATLFGGFCGFLLLMYFVLKGKPQAGLPLLNSGVIFAYLISSYAILGNFGLKVSMAF